MLNFEKILAKVLQPLLQRRDYGGNQLFKDYEEKVGKTPSLGNVWDVKAKLFDKNKKEIGFCIDTPNAIAKAFMEWDKAEYVKPFGSSIEPKSKYKDRMEKWNEAVSGLVKKASVTKKRRNGNWHTKSNNVFENVKRKFNTHEINF